MRWRDWPAGSGTPASTDRVTIVQALAASDAQSGHDVLRRRAVRAASRSRAGRHARRTAQAGQGASKTEIRRHRYDLPDGPAWLETRARAVRDAEGGLVVVRGTSQDVTAQELAAREVAYSRDFLQATLDSLPAHIVVLDAAGEILVTNRAWSEFASPTGRRRGRGGNYLAVCDAAAARTDASRRRRAAGDSRGARASCPEYACPPRRRAVVRRARDALHRPG